MKTEENWLTYDLGHSRLAGSHVNSRGYTAGSDAPSKQKKGSGRPPMQSTHREGMPSGIRELRRALADGQWRPRILVTQITKKYNLREETLLRLAGIFQSDSGKYVCLVNDDTPDLAPDGT